MLPLLAALLAAASASAADEAGDLLRRAREGAREAAPAPGSPVPRASQCGVSDLEAIYEVWGKTPEKTLASVYAKILAAAEARGRKPDLPLKVMVQAKRPPGAPYAILPDRFGDEAAFSPAASGSFALDAPSLRVGCGLFEWLRRDWEDLERRWVYRMRDQAAFVLAHELAHHLEGHLPKLAALKGKPGEGDAADRAQAALEREADLKAVVLLCGTEFDPAAGYGAMMNGVEYFKGLGVSVSGSHGGFEARARRIRSAADCCRDGVLDAACEAAL